MSRQEHFSTFKEEVKWLREGYMARRMASNLYEPADGSTIADAGEDHSGPAPIYEYWYEGSGSGQMRYVRLHDITSTLSGDILRLQKNLPADPYYIEIEGDIIQEVESVPQMPDEILPDDEDCSASLELLSVVLVDPTKHFTKKPKYNSEIHNHIKLREGTSDLSLNHVAPLLGKSTNNELVFPRMQTAIPVLASAQLHDLIVYKCWILDLISAIRQLHTSGILHKDLRIANILFTSRADERMDNGRVDEDGTKYRLVLCDVESRWGNRHAPELDKTFESDAGWTEKSDIYDIAGCIKGMIYANNPINPVVGAEWIVPKPLDEICSLCTIADPAKRPTLDELESIVKAIKIE